MTGDHLRRGHVPEYADTLSDEWFADYLARCATPRKRTRVMRDWIPQPQDVALRAEQAYDTETEALLKRIHNGSRHPVPGVTAPIRSTKGRAA